MSSLITVAELRGRPRTPGRVFEIAAAREVRLSRLLITHIATGLLFMLLPGTFLGVISGCVGWLAALTINLLSTVFLAWRGISPVLPHGFDQRFLVLQTWGFLVPFVWGFSAKWLPVFLGLRSTRASLLLRSVAVNTSGVLAAMFGWMKISMLLLAAGLVVAIYALRIFESPERPAKTGGVHRS